MNFLACGPGRLQDERDKVDVWTSVKLAPFSSLGHVTWAGAGCSNQSRVARNRNKKWKHPGTLRNR